MIGFPSKVRPVQVPGRREKVTQADFEELIATFHLAVHFSIACSLSWNALEAVCSKG